MRSMQLNRARNSGTVCCHVENIVHEAGGVCLYDVVQKFITVLKYEIHFLRKICIGEVGI